jgi:DNA-binding NarL/FixJ family response regulator
MEHRGFGIGSVALIVTGHRLLGEALGYALRLRAGFSSIYVVASFDATEAAQLLPQATVVLVDEEQLGDCQLFERIYLELRGTPVVVIAREVGAARDAVGSVLHAIQRVHSQSTIDDLICSLRRATRRSGLTLPMHRAEQRLSPREEETVSLIGAGLSNREIANRLGVSVATVKNHVHHVLTKLHARSRWQAAACALERKSPTLNEPKDSLSTRR